MLEPQVTITLGRSGQVVKRSGANQDGDAHTSSGKKRSLAENVGSAADRSQLSVNKRPRGDLSSKGLGSSRVTDARVGRHDLRYKILRKRFSRQLELEIEQQRRTELSRKESNTIQSIRGSERSSSRNIQQTGRSEGSMLTETLRSSYPSHPLDQYRSRSPNRVPRASKGFSSQGNISELRRVSSAGAVEISRTGRLLGRDALDHSPYRGGAAMTTRANLDVGKPFSSGVMLRGSYPDDQPTTVGGFLHALGLDKYSINFQAEEVDMAALKQMGDRDLKELGIPMGPRKKILLALMARARRPIM